MTELSPTDLQKLLESNSNLCLIDVRSDDEYKSGFIKGAKCLACDELENSLHQIPKDQAVVLYCKSGKRSTKAKEILEKHGFNNIKQLQGGISNWESSGLTIEKPRKAIPIQRQVMMIAGFLVVLGILLGFSFHKNFFYLSAFVGTGLFFAGLSGFCGMALILEKMPWNKINS